MAENTAGPHNTLMEDQYMVGSLAQSAKITGCPQMSAMLLLIFITIEYYGIEGIMWIL